MIVNKIIATNLDPEVNLLYNPMAWSNASNQPFPPNTSWLQPPVEKVINGRQDAFSQRYVGHSTSCDWYLASLECRLGQECIPGGFPSTIPTTALFDPKKVVLVGNGRYITSLSDVQFNGYADNVAIRCASSCALFTVCRSPSCGHVPYLCDFMILIDYNVQKRRIQNCGGWWKERCPAAILWHCWWPII
jgi:hypothetical protein